MVGVEVDGQHARLNDDSDKEDSAGRHAVQLVSKELRRARKKHPHSSLPSEEVGNEGSAQSSNLNAGQSSRRASERTKRRTKVPMERTLGAGGSQRLHLRRKHLPTHEVTRLLLMDWEEEAR